MTQPNLSEEDRLTDQQLEELERRAIQRGQTGFSHHSLRLDDVLSLVEEVRAARAKGWQPIETAPRDGTPILGWSNEGVSYVCWWPTRNTRDAWCFFDTGRGDSYSFYPTHFQPLPAPPQVKGVGDVG